MYRRHGSTMNADARSRYRHWYRMLRRKHPALYSRAGRRRLATESDLGLAGRLVYRWWWGARPLPARLEIAASGAALAGARLSPAAPSRS